MIHGDVLIVHGLQHDKDVSSDITGENSEQLPMIGIIIQLQEDLRQDHDSSWIGDGQKGITTGM